MLQVTHSISNGCKYWGVMISIPTCTTCIKINRYYRPIGAEFVVGISRI